MSLRFQDHIQQTQRTEKITVNVLATPRLQSTKRRRQRLRETETATLIPTRCVSFRISVINAQLALSKWSSASASHVQECDDERKYNTQLIRNQKNIPFRNAAYTIHSWDIRLGIRSHVPSRGHIFHSPAIPP